MKIYINTDVENYGLPRFLIKYIEKMGLRDKENNGIVFNIDAISTKGMMKGNICTVYLEGDEFLKKGIHKDRYEMADIFYILQKSYLHLYPPKTKILWMGVDPELHYPRDVKKEYDYVFVGRTTGNSVYDNRREVLEMFQKTKYKVLVTEGTQENYCDLLSSGRIILNILPRFEYDICTNLRILEGMAIGCLMTDYHPDLDDWGIVKNVHYLPLERFGDVSDDEIKRVHEAGRKYVLENFSSQEAVKTIVKDIQAFIDNITPPSLK